MSIPSRGALDGFGYATTPYRIEHRPTYGPHTQDQLLEMLNLLAECGVKAWWYSVAAKGSYPMFASKYLPYRDDAVDYFPWLVEQAHQREISLFSWEYLTTAPMLGAQHPAWRRKYFDWTGPSVPRDEQYVCWNSPYGELLKKYCVEVVGELHFDGIWFDGSFMHGHGASGDYACCCDFCAEKYKRQTGNDLPTTIDLRDRSVREYLEWRYLDHIEYWRDLSGYVRRAVPKAIIAFNYFNRFDGDIMCGCPLRRMTADAPQWPDDQSHGPMEGMISTEVSVYPQQTMLLGKILRSVNDNYPVEMWGYGMDIPELGCATSNPDPRGMLLHARLCATVGAYASIGMGREELRDYRHAMKALSSEIDPIAPYIGGAPQATIGLVVSGCTKDYAFVSDTHPQGRPGPTWSAATGMHNLLNALRLQSEVLLDNMLRDDFLNQYPAVILPDVVCMSDAAGDALRQYVENGGVLLAVGETATRTELGDVRETGLLESIFDITWRDDRAVNLELQFDELLQGTFDDITGRTTDGLPQTYRLPGLGRLVRSHSAEVLASGYYPIQQKKVYTPQGLRKPGEADVIQGAAVLRRKVGKGQALWILPDIATAYATLGQNPYSRMLVDLLLKDIPRPVSVTAPPNVAVNLFRQEGRSVLHVLNVPETLLHVQEDHSGRFTPDRLVPLDTIPTGPVRIQCEGQWKFAFSPTHKNELAVRKTASHVECRLDMLDQYAMIVLEEESGVSDIKDEDVR